jgi:mycothiol synthase
MTHLWRPYQDNLDRESLLDLLVASHEANLADSEFRSTEITALLTRHDFDSRRNTRVLIADDGRMLAFGVLWRGRILGYLVHPERHQMAEPALIEWAEDTAGREGAVMTRDDNQFVVNHLLARGYTAGERELRMVRDLSLDIPEPTVPDGYQVRHLTGPYELPEWVALYNHAFGDTSIPGPTTVERWKTRLADPDYDDRLNIVVTDDAGEIVAMCHCSISSFEQQRMAVKTGRTEPIATRADHRRKGLAQAAILTGLQRLRSKGMDVALLTTDSTNSMAHRLYESLDYHVTYSAVWFTRSGPKQP